MLEFERRIARIGFDHRRHYAHIMRHDAGGRSNLQGASNGAVIEVVLKAGTPVSLVGVNHRPRQWLEAQHGFTSISFWLPCPNDEVRFDAWEQV